MSEMLRISAGAIVWAVHFAVVYGVTALACAREQPRLAPWIVTLATVAGAAIASAIVVRSYRRRDDFARWLTAAVAATAVVAMLWEALASLLAGSCV